VSGSHHATPLELLMSGGQHMLSSAWKGTQHETTSVYENRPIILSLGYLQRQLGFFNIKLVRFSFQLHY